MNSSFYVTTPIYYVNAQPHIGHAYTTIMCDMLARFHRLDGVPHVRFLTGTDEYGQKVEKSAQAAGLSPQAFTDSISARFRGLAELFHCSNDDFIRTTEARHTRAAQAFWNRLQERGYLYLGQYAGWYSVRDEAYYQEAELVDGKAPTGSDVEWVGEEESYFFRLSAFQQPLLDLYANQPDFVLPATRLHEVRSFVQGGKTLVPGSLRDLSVSRTTVRWGIPVPGAPRHVMYVWLDALVNYLSALGYPDTDAPMYTTYWPPSVHMVGKDILRFHAVYWPAFLMAADLPLPQHIAAHGWWLHGGDKMSKSLGNIVDPVAVAQWAGVDALRYFLLREVSFGQDGTYTQEHMVRRINTDLANTLGNLAQRTLSMIQKHVGGRVPTPSAELDSEITALLARGCALRVEGRRWMEQCRFEAFLDAVIRYAVDCNGFIDSRAPWTLQKQGQTEALHTVLYTVAEALRQIAILLQPSMPEVMGQLLNQLGADPKQRSFADLEHPLIPGTPMPAPQALFPRLVGEMTSGSTHQV